MWPPCSVLQLSLSSISPSPLSPSLPHSASLSNPSFFLISLSSLPPLSDLLSRSCLLPQMEQPSMDQKGHGNVPWIVEPGQEAKRGVNTKYETTIF